MKSENEWIYERWQLYRLIQANPDWSLRAYAHEIGHDPKWVSKWRKRFQEQPSPTLEVFQSRSRRPKHSPRQLGKTLKDTISALRETLSERFHRAAGPKTIRYFLGQGQQAVDRIPGLSSIYRVLRERAYIRPRLKVIHNPLVLPSPMDEWEIDFGEIYLGPSEGRLEFFVAVDKGTSRVVYLEGSSGYRSDSALDALVHLFTQHGLPKWLRFDRDPRLWGSWTRDSFPSPMLRFLHALGIRPIVCPPHRPDKKPMVERCIGTLKHEWLARYSPTTMADALALLDPFIPYHNTQRPHQGLACDNRTPDEAFPVLPDLPALPKRVKPDAWLMVEERRVYRRRVNASGTIRVDRYTYYVAQAAAGLSVLVHLDARNALFHITSNGQLLRSVPIKGLHPGEYDLLEYVDLLKAEARDIEQFRSANWQQPGDPF